jgi:ketosteroid isomerase-like protein
MLRHRVLLGGCALVAACSTPPAAPGDAAAFHERLIQAFNRCDDAAVQGAYAHDFAFTTSFTKAALQTTDGLRGYLAAACRQGAQVTPGSQTISAAGATSVVTGQYLFRLPRAGGGTAETAQNYTLVLRRQADGWRVWAHHISVAP